MARTLMRVSASICRFMQLNASVIPRWRRRPRGREADSPQPAVRRGAPAEPGPQAAGDLGLAGPASDGPGDAALLRRDSMPASAGPGDATRPHSNFRRHWRCGRAAPVPRSNFRRLWPRAAGDCRRCTWRPGAGDRSTWRYGSSPFPSPGSRGLGLAKAVKSWSRRGLPAAPPAKAVESWSGTGRRSPWGLPQPAPPPLRHRLRDPCGEDGRVPRGDSRRSACGGFGSTPGSMRRCRQLS